MDAPGDGDVIDGAVQFPADWWDTNYAHRNRITIHGSMLDEGVSSFPLYVHLHGLPGAQADGTDLRFIAEDGTTVLSYEIETASGGDFAVWVNVPDIRGRTVDDWVDVYYDNGSAAAGAQPEAVWPDPFVAVWHLSNDRDSTAARNDGELVGTTDVSGVAGDALQFNTGSDVVAYSRVAATTSLNGIGPGSASWSAWVNFASVATAYAAAISREAGGGSGNDFWLGLDNTNSPRAEVETSQGDYVTTGMPIALNQWALLAMSYDNSNLSITVNGTLVATTGAHGTIDSSLTDVMIGAKCDGCGFVMPNTNAFDGMLDEVRIENVARDDGWFAAEAANLIGDPPLATLGAIEP